MHWLVNELMEHGGDGGVQHKGNQEQEGKQGNDGHAAQEQGGVIFDVIQS